MKKFSFAKMSGSGNDFVVIDNREGILPEPLSKFAARICDRRRAVGADGLLLLEKRDREVFRMRYFNADGSPAEMCGNGARCIAYFANLIGASGPDMRMESPAGDFKASVVKDGWVRLYMPPGHSLGLNLELSVGQENVRGHFLNTGVPHFVVAVENIEKADLEKFGPKLRFHSAFAPKGSNVNFAQVLGENEISVRTYERGVEGETLACGTGAVASAVSLSAAGNCRSPVRVRTRGGDVLEVAFRLCSGGAEEIELSGGAEVTFQGEMELDHLLGR